MEGTGQDRIGWDDKQRQGVTRQDGLGSDRMGWDGMGQDRE